MPPHFIPAPHFPDNPQDYAPWVAEHGLTAPYGECQCCCGQPAPVATVTSAHYGSVIGHPRRFIHNHHGVGSGTNNHTAPPLIERLWKKTLVVGKCWLWQGCTNSHYGVIGVDGRRVYIHRASYELHNGPIPDRMNINHNCPTSDNKLCWNPAHLWLGSQLENIADAVQKRQNPRGERSGMAKLTDDDIRQIRDLRAQGWKLDEIAAQFGITYSNVGMIARGDTWRHI